MLRILLVDDEKYTIEGLVSMLDWERFEGELSGTASSGEEALKLLESVRPDVIISDIKMGGMNGIELARQVHERQEQIQMILLTAHGEFEYARQAIRYGVIDYILKPITRDKLEQLNCLLEQKNQQLRLRQKSYQAAWDDSLKERLLNALKIFFLPEIREKPDTTAGFFRKLFLRGCCYLHDGVFIVICHRLNSPLIKTGGGP